MKKLYTEFEEATKVVEDTVESTDKLIAPIRTTFFKRFPTVALFLVTCGAAMTILGIERFVESIPFFDEHPFAIFVSGVALLFITGRLYKKLG